MCARTVRSVMGVVAPHGVLARLAAVRAEVEYIQKGGRNSAQGYSFLSERQITELFKQLLDKHGVFFHYSSVITASRVTPSGKQTLTDVSIEYAFIDVETGEKLEGRAAGQGTDSGDKGVYKAITGAIKYVFMKTFLIPTGDDPEEERPDEKREARKRETTSYGTSYGLSYGQTDTSIPPFGPGSDEEKAMEPEID